MKKKIALISLIFLILDMSTKIIIDYNFYLLESKEIIKNFFSITKVYNYGASWNILTGSRIVLIIIGILALVILFNYQKKFTVNKRNTLAFCLLYSGIVGNMIDRIIHGYVIDFLDFLLFNYDFPVFNLADIYIVIGIFLMMIAIFKKEDVNEINSGYKR